MRRVVIAMTVLMSVPAIPAGAEETARSGAEVCVTCHSPPAHSHSHSAIPSLDGRPAGELLRILLAFRDGSRPATIMDRITRGYTPEQLGGLAGELSRRNLGGPP